MGCWCGNADRWVAINALGGHRLFGRYPDPAKLTGATGAGLECSMASGGAGGDHGALVAIISLGQRWLFVGLIVGRANCEITGGAGRC